MKTFLTISVVTATLFSTSLFADTTSFEDVLAAQEVLTISPVEVDGLPIVGLDLAASMVCKTAGYAIVRDYEIARAPLGPVGEAYRFEENVLKKVKVAGSYAMLKKVICGR